MNDDGAKSPICRSAADSRYGFSAERSIGRLGDVISPWFWNCGSLIDDGECRRIEMLVFCEECGCKNLLEETGGGQKTVKFRCVSCDYENFWQQPQQKEDREKRQKVVGGETNQPSVVLEKRDKIE